MIPLITQESSKWHHQLAVQASRAQRSLQSVLGSAEAANGLAPDMDGQVRALKTDILAILETHAQLARKLLGRVKEVHVAVVHSLAEVHLIRAP